jgi:hypothetical protein
MLYDTWKVSLNEIDLVYKIAAELFNNKEKSSVLDKYSNLVNKKRR